MSEITSFDFNTLQFCRDFGRTKAPILMTYYIMKSLKIDKLPKLNPEQIAGFCLEDLQRIQQNGAVSQRHAWCGCASNGLSLFDQRQS